LRAVSEMAAGAVVCAVLAGCWPSRYEYAACETDTHCRDSFGFGSTCRHGLCEPAKLNDRCDTTYPPDLLQRADRYRQAIVFGSLMDRSSPAHVVREKAIRLAVKEVEEKGGLEGRPVGVVFCNTEARDAGDHFDRTEATRWAARYLVSHLGVSALVGPCASTDAEQVWSDLRASHTPIVSPAATSPALDALEPGGSEQQPGWLWRVAPSDALQGRVIAEDLLARNVRSAAVLREAGPYGEALASVFMSHFTAAGGTVRVLGVAGASQIGEATAMAGAGAATEVLFISSQQDWIAKFLNAASGHAGFAAKSIFLTDAAANEAVLAGATLAAPLFPRIRGTRPAPLDRSSYVYASFIANYRAEYGGDDPTGTTFSAHAYDAAWLVMYGSAWSLLREGRVSGPGIARGLRQVGSGARVPVIPSSWLTLQSTFRAGEPVDLSGASGELAFDLDTRQIAAPIEVWTVSPGPVPAIVRAEPPSPPAEAERSL
jgi:branched-chain amino acid transport system substrate-binding protein